MAKSKGKTKSKGNLVETLLKKAETIALVVAGGGLAILLIAGILKGVSAKSADEHSKPLENGAKSIKDRIANGQESPPAQPEWLYKSDSLFVDANRFATANPPFDPTATPNNKRENPQVLGIEGQPQVDLVRAPMMGYDVYYDPENKPWIAVLKKTTVNAIDPKSLQEMKQSLTTKGRNRRPVAAAQQMPPGTQQVAGGPIGLASGQPFDQNSKREEITIEYIPLELLDSSKKTPALTLIPLRLAIVQATFPLKKQIEEMQRALRLQKPEMVAPFGPVFDGFEVRRQIYGPPGKDGKLPVLQPMEAYNFEEKFESIIDSRILGYHFDTGFLPYFLRFEEGLAWPLPRLMPELAGTYPPPVQLKPIVDAMDNLRNASKVEVSPSDLLKRLQGKASGEGGKRRFVPGISKGAEAFKEQLPGALLPMSTPPAPPKPGEAPQAAFDPEYLLLRFVDPDIRPGLTYEYQIRIRMKNPNFGQTDLVSNPSYAVPEILYSPWTQISDQVYVPNESFLFGYDPAKFREALKEITSDPAMQRALRPADNQAVVQVQSWMEQVRVDGSGNREPVGAWVIAEMPVSRGEYIGRKQYIKLPLWAAEHSKFVLRDAINIPSSIRVKEKPKGWVVDFSTKSILVDFDGGKVSAKVGPRGNTVTDEVSTELLIVRPDGRLIVKNAVDDMKDPERARNNDAWNKWVKEVETRKESGSTDSGFTRP